MTEKDETNTIAYFESLYNDNKEGIYIYLVRTVRDPDTASDLMQDVFLNFFRYYKNRDLPDPVSAKKILYRTGHNLAVNFFSRSGYQREILTQPEAADIHSHETDITERMYNEELEKKLQSMLSRLPPEQRTAVILRYYQDFRLEDISEILGVSVSTVSRMIRKGVKELIKMHESEKKK